MSDMAPDTVSALDLIRHFWRRRVFLLLLPPMVFVGAYFFIRSFVPETYQSQAMLMLRTAPSELRDAPRMKEVDPPVYEDFLLNDELLFSVLEAARENDPSLRNAHFEDFRKSFRVKTIMTRDTSVQATYSPVLVLTVLSGSPQGVHFLATEWVKRSLENFGQLRSREAKAVESAMSEQFEVYAQQSVEMARREAELLIREEQLELLVDMNTRLVAGSESSVVTVQQQSATPPLPDEMDLGSQQSEQGLFGQRVRLELEIAATAAVSSPEMQARNGEAKARLAKLDEMIGTALGAIEDLKGQRVQLTVELEEVRRNLLIARERMSLLRSVMTTALADATLVSDWLKKDNQGDLLLIAEPVVPEKRIGPPRLLLSLAITAVLIGLLFLLFGLELFFKRSVVGR